MINLSAAGVPAPAFGEAILSKVARILPRHLARLMSKENQMCVGRPTLLCLGRAAPRIVSFLCVGLVGLSVDASLFSALHAMGTSRALARAISLVAATGVTWRLNRRFTFAATGRRARTELGRYAAVTLLAQGTSYGTFLSLSRIAPTASPLLLLVAGAALATGVSFAGQRLFTFRAAS